MFILLALSLVAAGDSAAGDSAAVADRPPAPGEKMLQSRLLAPCCYVQTLDVHESDSAQELRLEIRRRLYEGETVEAVEQSLVLRYGERVRAAPPSDPMRVVAPVLLVLAAVAAAGVIVVLRRWRRASAAHKPAPASPPDAYDERLDAELKALD